MGTVFDSTIPLGSRRTDPMNPLSGQLHALLGGYPEARRIAQFSGSHPLFDTIRSTAKLLKESAPVSGRPSLTVDWSLGQGNWASVPWIALLDRRETTTTRHGVYVVYLFREDGSGVLLTLNQGVTEFTSGGKGRTQARAEMRTKAQQLRPRVAFLAEEGFSLDDGIDLRTTSNLGRDYEHSTIAYKLYGIDAIPDDEEMLAELNAVLLAYDRYLDEKGGRDVPSSDPPVPEHPHPTTVVRRDPRAILLDALAAFGLSFTQWEIATYFTGL